MNNLLNELSQIAKLPFNEIMNDYKFVIISDKILHLSNFIKILDYTSDCVKVLVKKNKSIEIVGENLHISQINKQEIIIKGKILNLGLGAKSEK